jgi:putative (di)nucleoside polyphosphate hydrolase
LARYLPRANHHNRYLRSGMRPHRQEGEDVPRATRQSDALAAQPESTAQTAK